MKQDGRQLRQAEIEAVAYGLLEERGYAGMSMLSVAKAARASNETLYRWYGDKLGLCCAMIAANTAEVQLLLAQWASRKGEAMAAIRALCPVLLGMLVGERAVALNRAAAADASGALGAAIAAGGRAAVMPGIEALMARALDEGTIYAPDAAEAAEWLVRVLVGDWQIRRVIHAMPEPDKATIAARAEEGFKAFSFLCAAG
ncbi:MAG: TetR/AcrR family transcriptional regulator [Paracoccaceae bacterium]